MRRISFSLLITLKDEKKIQVLPNGSILLKSQRHPERDIIYTTKGFKITYQKLRKQKKSVSTSKLLPNKLQQEKYLIYEEPTKNKKETKKKVEEVAEPTEEVEEKIVIDEYLQAKVTTP